MKETEYIEHSGMKHGISWIALKAALETEGCPVCNVMRSSVKRYFEFLLYESALDAEVHKKNLSSFGMCNIHSKLLKETEYKLNSDGLNIAVLYETLLKKEIKLLNEITEIKLKKGGRFLKKLDDKRKYINYKKEILLKMKVKEICLGCLQQKQSEAFYTHEIIRSFNDNDFRKLYSNQKTLLCRRHFLFLINETTNREVLDFFVEHQIQKITILSEQLSGFIDHHDYRFSDLISDDERKSWEEVLRYTGSDESISKESTNDLLV